MNIDAITAELRPRTGWEAIDLGCLLVRRSFGKLFLIWCLTAVPVCLLLLGFFYRIAAPGWAVFWTFLCIFLLRPQFERPILYFLGRDLFSAPPRVLDVVKAWPKLFFQRFFFWTLSGRISVTNRSQVMPVDVLENLRGTDFKKRANSIGRYYSSEATSIQFLVCHFMEYILAGGFLFLAWQLFPGAFQTDTESLLFNSLDPDQSAIPEWVLWTQIVLFMLAMAIMEPFYVGAGFALYLSSRSRAEGWDIEVAFRRLSKRLADNGLSQKPPPPLKILRPKHRERRNLRPGTTSRGTASLLAFCFLFVLFQPGESTAETNPEKAIETILSHEDFQEKFRTINTRSPNFQPRDVGALNNFFPALGEILFWGVAAIVITGLVYLIVKNWDSIIAMLPSRGPAKPEAPTARTVMGLDVQPESLPDDVIGEVRRLWNSGDAVAALSLLYRGCISRLIQNHQIPIRDSDTERDCVRRVRAQEVGELPGYVDHLTRIWTQLAYGNITPQSADVTDLCDRWPFNKQTASGTAAIAKPASAPEGSA